MPNGRARIFAQLESTCIDRNVLEVDGRAIQSFFKEMLSPVMVNPRQVITERLKTDTKLLQALAQFNWHGTYALAKYAEQVSYIEDFDKRANARYGIKELSELILNSRIEHLAEEVLAVRNRSQTPV